MKSLFALLFLAPLAACASRPEVRPEPIVAPIEVAIPVAAPCVPNDLKPKPIYPDEDAALRAAADAAERYQLVLAGREKRRARLNEIEPIIEACPRGTSK